MVTRRRLRSVVAAAFLVVASLPIGAPLAAAAGDVTPPSGSVELWNMDNETQIAELHLSYSDPESGIDHLLVICDNGPQFIVPYATKLFWPMHDGSGGCTTDYGEHWIQIQAYNGDGLSSNAGFAGVTNGPTMHLTVSAAPTTGAATASCTIRAR